MLHSPLIKMLFTLSKALDLVGGSHFSCFSHGLRVAYIGGRMAEGMGFTPQEKEALLVASLIHDIGVSSSVMMQGLVEFEVQAPEPHAIRGAQLLAKSDLFTAIAPIIRHHHSPYRGNPSEKIANIIHLADRVAVCIEEGRAILPQRTRIMGQVEQAATLFWPAAMAEMRILAEQEAFWIDMVSSDIVERVAELYRVASTPIDLTAIGQLAIIFADVIDDKSPFTAQHSWDVTRVALELSENLGFTPEQLEQMRIAALLHDLGKLGIEDVILDKPGSLSADEMTAMKAHPYYTYHLLKRVDGLETIARWAGYHHERIDGKGYPFHLGAQDLDLGSRIVAVSDVFAALRQHRPYRLPVPHDQTRTILASMVANGALDGRVVGIIIDQYDTFAGLVHTSHLSERFQHWELQRSRCLAKLSVE